MRSTKALIATAATALFATCVTSFAQSNDRFGLGAQPQVYLAHSTVQKDFRLDGEWSRQVSRWAPGSAFVVQAVIASRGAEAEQTLELVDPVAVVKDRLAEHLKRELELTNVSVLPDGFDAEGLDAFREKTKAGVLMVAITRYWGIDDYRAKYSADVKLIDLAQSIEITSSSCPRTVENVVDSSVTRDPVARREAALANKGEALNAAFREAAVRCARQIAFRIVDRKK